LQLCHYANNPLSRQENEQPKRELRDDFVRIAEARFTQKQNKHPHV